MKSKIILFVTVLMIVTSSSVFAQNIKKTIPLPKSISFKSAGRSSTAFMQEPNGGSGMSSFIDQDNMAYLSADDFEVSEATSVDAMEFVGYQQSANLPDIYTGITLNIYEDDNGLPAGMPGKYGTPIYSLDIPKNDPRITLTTVEEDYFDYMISTPGLTLQPDKRYWVVFAPRIVFSEKFMAEEMFTWLNGTTFNFDDAVVTDRDNYYQAGMTYWISATEMTAGEYGDDFRSLCFAIYSNSNLATNDVLKHKSISIYPNPSSDKIFIKSNDQKISNLTITNGEGREVSKTAGSSIDIHSLAPGLYIVKVNFADGASKNMKFIKK